MCFHKRNYIVIDFLNYASHSTKHTGTLHCKIFKYPRNVPTIKNRLRLITVTVFTANIAKSAFWILHFYHILKKNTNKML